MTCGLETSGIARCVRSWGGTTAYGCGDRII